jgi:hypothetical protein
LTPDEKAAFAAQDYIKETIPGAEEVDWTAGTIRRSEDRVIVRMPVDGKNAFGGPVRKIVTVTMEPVGDDYRLVGVTQD